MYVPPERRHSPPHFSACRRFGIRRCWAAITNATDMGSVAATREKLGDLDEFYYSSIADGASIVCANGGKTAWLGTPRTFEASVEVNF
jgi:hypothetical protein